MLPQIYSRRPLGQKAEYSAEYARIAVDGFLERIPEGEELYRSGLRDFAHKLYFSALSLKKGADTFLDKTPRYYFVIRELRKIFPDAGIIVLVRNPLSVLASITNYNFGGNWWKMLQEADRRHDLITAPKLISQAIDEGWADALVKYENLISDSESEMRGLCKKLGLKFSSEMLEYGTKTHFENTTFIDTKSVYKHEHPVKHYLDSWREFCATPENALLAINYIDQLGEHVLSSFGEDMVELKASIYEQSPLIHKSLSCQKSKAIFRSLEHGPAALGFKEKLAVRGSVMIKNRLRRIVS